MKKTMYYFLFLTILFQWSYSQEGIDPDYLKENIPSSPESASLGKYGEISTTPYNGKINVSVPIHNITIDGLNIPIQLSYDSGGVRVDAEASWVGMNWNLSANAAISRTIFGNDDLNENIVPNAVGDISAYVYSDIEVIDPGVNVPYVPLDDIIRVHSSYGTGGSTNAPDLNADTQPDIFNVSVFGSNYKFKLNKRIGTSNIITTHILNNNFASITYNLSDQSFKVIDDRGFEFIFTTKDYAASISSSRSSTPANAVSGTKEHTIDGLLDDLNQTENTAITSWLLDSITTPNGKNITFSYVEGAHFTFPMYSGSVGFIESAIDQGDELGQSYTSSAVKYTSSMSIIHSNYLSKITGDFGELIFNSSESRKDLLTGNDLKSIFPGTFSPIFTSFTKTNTVNRLTESHGTPNASHYKPTARQLNSIELRDYNNNLVKAVNLNYSYYNNHKLNLADEAKFLRLKLDEVSIEDNIYSFNYNTPNELPEKGSLDTDFWGFYNGANNTTHVPSIGRFCTTQTHNDPPNSDPSVAHNNLGQIYFNFNGGDRGANFNYGNKGNLTEIHYPTGGYSKFNYEGNIALEEVANPYLVTDYFEGTNQMRWTNLIDEDKYRFTYQYLKRAKTPSYNFFENRYVPDENTIETPVNFSTDFTITNTGVLQADGDLALFTWNDDTAVDFLDVAKYYVENVNDSSLIYPLFFYGDWEGIFPGNSNAVPGSNSVILPPGTYRLKNAGNPIGSPGVALLNSSYILYETVQDPNESSPEFLENFEVGGARIKSITNYGNENEFINKKIFDYEFPNDNPLQQSQSSGKLMDDLIYHTKYSGFYSYNPVYPGPQSSSDGTGVKITSNNNLRQNPNAQGSFIGYSFVSERSVDRDDTVLSTINRAYVNNPNKYFKHSFETIYWWNPYHPAISIDYAETRNAILLGMNPKLSFEYINGSLLNEYYYDCMGNLVRSVTNEYTTGSINKDDAFYANFMSVTYIPEEIGEAPWFENNETYITYKLPFSYSRKSGISHSQTIEYLSGEEFVTDAYYLYDDINYNVKENEVVVGNGESNITKYFYPYSSEVAGQNGISNLIQANQYTQIVKSEAFFNNQKLATSTLTFANNTNTGGNVRVVSSNASKGDNALETRSLYEKYDEEGMLLQTRAVNGEPISYIYGYNNQYVIAKIENATYSQISNYVSNIKTKSNADNDSCNNGGNCEEEELRGALSTLRTNLPNAQVTTYTYNPMVGVTSITAPNGIMSYYEYDDNNRLTTIRDFDNKIISRYEYNINNDLLNTLGTDAIGIQECNPSTGNDDPGSLEKDSGPIGITKPSK